MWKVRPDEKSRFVDLEIHMIRAHYIIYAVSCITLAICFAYFGRKVKGFAEDSIGLLIDSEMDSRYGRLRLMRRSITRVFDLILHRFNLFLLFNCHTNI